MDNIFLEAKMVWARRGDKITRKYRCTLGQRKHKIVANPSQCFANINMKQRFNMKRLHAQQGYKISKKSLRTKKFSPKSKILRSLNK